MSFIEDVKDYLQRVHDSKDVQEPTPPILLEPEWIRAETLRLLERLESKSPEPRSRSAHTKTYLQWMAGERAVGFADILATLLQESFLAGASRTEIEDYVRLAIAKRIGLKERAATLTRDLELEHLSEQAWAESDSPVGGPDDWHSIPDYAREIRATRVVRDRVELTPIGNVLLALTGRDAVQWLLNVEAAQSTGPDDDWRLSRGAAERLLKSPRFVEEPGYWRIVDHGLSWSTLRRLRALGLLQVVDEMALEEDETDLFGYELLEPGIRALEVLLTPNGTPFSVLAATLSQDEALAALEGSSGRALPEASLNTSAMATARQARLVAHEIRNALIPAQVALSSLYGALGGSSAETELTRLRPRIDPGINRVLKFVNDLLKTSELATRPPEAFNLFRAVVDAKSSISTTLGIGVSGSMDLPSVLGYRERFVLAVVNLLRNAEQVGAKNVDITVTLEDDSQNLLLLVDDDGPGVSVEHRERIFQRGVTLRTGGAGEGLALVKEVIEFELRGKIACVDKPGGGARFQMRLPVAERSLR
ncbi:HAMP domain-containing histidine kinase [Pyxidicoccus parkwayensis]|uniref:histidine kinase n=1 Tax=Pyxidicoccus parkwayensis TaxID=2813578 RepID=A0ABX7NRR6_9BACT|nr:HAMP domain-containing sensor histidine kinase [Pyxidicoccus parkwaysis]QSQ21039.1 HAMP domain-containing histidine kinase [Pyxidicoccus parkwaysis]